MSMQQPQAPTTTPRHQAGSLTRHPAAATSPQAVVAECGGNLQLLEARVCELTLSIRALHRSNLALQQALLDDDPKDPDFVQAIEENRAAMLRQGQMAAACVRAMQDGGAARVDLDADIRDILAKVKLEQEVAAADATVVAKANANDNTNDPSATVDEGLHL